MTGRRAWTASVLSFAPSPTVLPPLHGHARACPGHPRRPAPSRVLGSGRGRPGALRLGTAWVAGTSPAMTGRRVGIVSDPSFAASPACLHPLHGHARACPGHPRRPAPSRVLGPGRSRSGLGAARRGVGGRDKPGHDGTEGGDRFGSLIHPLRPISSTPSIVMPGLVPGTHAGPRHHGGPPRAERTHPGFPSPPVVPGSPRPPAAPAPRRGRR